MGNYLYLPSSLGTVYPREQQGEGRAAYTETTNAPFEVNHDYYQHNANELGTVTVNGHTYTALHGRYNSSPTLWLLCDGTMYYESYLNVVSTYCGFFCDIINGEATVYWVTFPDPNTLNGYEMPLRTGYSAGMQYEARVVVDHVAEEDIDLHKWDDPPSTDPSDPGNDNPRGGEYSDTMPLSETDVWDLDDLPEPEQVMSYSYGKMLRTYVLDETQFQAIGNQLFTPGFWTELKDKFQGLSDPLSMIVNCIQLPYKPSSSAGTFVIGGVELKNGSNPVDANFTLTRYKKFPMGSIHLREVWGTEKDYNECSVQIYLPYVGMKELDPEIVVGQTCTLYCYIDIWTGDLLYMLHTDNKNSARYFHSAGVAYRWTGNCAKKVPIGRFDNSNQILGMVGAVAGIGLGLATAGIGAVGAMGALGGMAAAGSGASALGGGLATMELGGKIAAGAAGAAAAKGLSSGFKPIVQSSGGVSGQVGAMDIQQAYLITKRAVPQYPHEWRSQIGATRYQTFSGTDLHGYTLFSSIHLEGISFLSDAEIAELERELTTEGVIL